MYPRDRVFHVHEYNDESATSMVELDKEMDRFHKWPSKAPSKLDHCLLYNNPIRIGSNYSLQIFNSLHFISFSPVFVFLYYIYTSTLPFSIYGPMAYALLGYFNFILYI